MHLGNVHPTEIWKEQFIVPEKASFHVSLNVTLDKKMLNVIILTPTLVHNLSV